MAQAIPGRLQPLWVAVGLQSGMTPWHSGRSSGIGRHTRERRPTMSTRSRWCPKSRSSGVPTACRLCGKGLILNEGARHPKGPSVDHIVWLSRVSSHTFENCQAPHLGCNRREGMQFRDSDRRPGKANRARRAREARTRRSGQPESVTSDDRIGRFSRVPLDRCRSCRRHRALPPFSRLRPCPGDWWW